MWKVVEDEANKARMAKAEREIIKEEKDVKRGEE